MSVQSKVHKNNVGESNVKIIGCFEWHTWIDTRYGFVKILEQSQGASGPYKKPSLSCTVFVVIHDARVFSSHPLGKLYISIVQWRTAGTKKLRIMYYILN